MKLFTKSILIIFISLFAFGNALSALAADIRVVDITKLSVTPGVNHRTTSTTPTIVGATGAAIANGNVTIKEGATTLCTTTANSGGAFSCTISTALSTGTHTLSIVEDDGAGSSSTSLSYTIVVGPFTASDLIGQYDHNQLQNMVPIYTTNGANNQNGVNNLGFSTTAYDVAVDHVRHRMYVADRFNSRVLVYNLDTNNNLVDKAADYVLGRASLKASTNLTDPQANLVLAMTVTVDEARGYVFVAGSCCGAFNGIKVFDTSNGITDGMNASFILGQATFGGSSTAVDQNTLGTVGGFYFDQSTSRLYASDINRNRVLVFDLSAGITNGMAASWVLGQSNFTSSATGNSSTQIPHPAGIAMGPGNTLYIVANPTRVMVFDTSAGITNGMAATHILGQSSFTGTASGVTATTLNYTYDVVVDQTTNKVFVSDGGANRVLVFNAADGITDGEAAVAVIGQPNFTSSSGAATQAGMSEPLFMDINNSKLYVPNWNGGGINRSMVTIYDISGTITNGQNAIDEIGQYDHDQLQNMVAIYTTDGANNQNGVNNLGLRNPQGMSIDTIGHRLFVADKTNNRVLVYNLDTNNLIIDRIPDYVIGQPNFKTATSGVTNATLNNPSTVLYSANKLFVADQNNNRVLVFDLSAGITNGMAASWVLGQPNFTSNTSSTTQSSISSPGGFAVSANKLFVASFYGNRVLVFDLSAGITNGMAASNVIGQPDFVTSTANTTQSGLYGASEIGVYSGKLFVNNYFVNRTTVYNIADGVTNGEAAVAVIGQPSYTSSTGIVNQVGMMNPVGMSIDSEKLYIAFDGFNSVRVYDLSDGVLEFNEPAIGVIGQPDFTTSSPGLSQTAMRDIEGVAVFGSTVYASEWGNNRISIFNITPTNQTDTTPPNAILVSTITPAHNSTITTPPVITGAVGSAESGATVVVKDSFGNTVCSTTAASNGSWTCPTFEPAPGVQTYSITQTDTAGNVSFKTQYTLTYSPVATTYVGGGSGITTGNVTVNAPAVTTTPATTQTTTTQVTQPVVIATIPTGPSCYSYTKPFKVGRKYPSSWKNEVTQIQTFLNTQNLGTTVKVTGIYDKATSNLVKRFQAKYSKEILGAVDAGAPTGHWLGATMNMATNISCNTQNTYTGTKVFTEDYFKSFR